MGGSLGMYVVVLKNCETQPRENIAISWQHTKGHASIHRNFEIGKCALFKQTFECKIKRQLANGREAYSSKLLL